MFNLKNYKVAQDDIYIVLKLDVMILDIYANKNKLNIQRTDYEIAESTEFILNVVSKDGHLGIVTISSGRAIALDGGPILGQAFDSVKVQPLVDRRELSRAGLHDFLGNNAADYGVHRRQISSGDFRKRVKELFVDFDIDLTILHVVLGEVYKLVCVLLVGRPRRPAEHFFEFVQSQECDVQLLGIVHLAKVGDDKFGRLYRILHRPERHLFRHLHLSHDSATGYVVRQTRRVPDAERIRTENFDLPRLAAVQLHHSFDLKRKSIQT